MPYFNTCDVLILSKIDMLKSIRKILNNECPCCDQGKVFRDKSF